MTHSTLTINDLPVEMIGEIFKHLSLKSLVTCSMVNKCWHSLSSYAGLDRLTVHNNFHYFKCHFDQAISEERELCHPKNFPKLLDKPVLSNLKRLIFCYYHFSDDPKFDLNRLNELSQLVHLKIELWLNKQVIFSLPRLEVLEILKNFECKVTIDCPKLRVLCYKEQSDLLDVKYPETIRKLETNMSGSKLERFINLECLISLRKFKHIGRGTLQVLHRLNELHHNVRPSSLLTKETKRDLKELLDDLEALKSPDFQFTFAGLRLTMATFDQVDLSTPGPDSSDFYAKNYRLVVPNGTLEFIKEMIYNHWMSHVEIPMEFLQKLIGVQCVHVRGVVQDVDHLLAFLSSLKALRRLSLNQSGLGQQFYDLLSASAHGLTHLEIEDNNQLNLNFLSEFQFLLAAIIRFELSLDSVTLLLQIYEGSRDFFLTFRFRGSRFKVERNWSDSTIHQIWRQMDNFHIFLQFESEHLHEILDYFARQ